MMLLHERETDLIIINKLMTPQPLIPLIKKREHINVYILAISSMLLEKRVRFGNQKGFVRERGKEMTRWQLSANPDQEI